MGRKKDPTFIIELANWVEALSLSKIPETAIHAAKRCIIDTLGVAVAGSHKPVAKRIGMHVAREYNMGPCTILGTSQQVSATGAALANGTSAHALDFDDMSYAGQIHGSVIMLPAVLAVAEYMASNGRQFLKAFIGGSETAYALGLLLTYSHYLSGWWATATLGAIGAAAGSGKVLGLTSRELTAAISLATIQANGMVVMLGYDAKPILAGQAARLGVESALLASQGNTAPENAFEDPRGFLELMNKGRSEVSGLSGLGEKWRIDDPGVLVKHSPVCSAALAAIQVTKSLIEENSILPARIKAVRCEVPHLVKISLIHDRPKTLSEAQFSMPFAIGCILSFGMLGPEQLSDKVFKNDELRTSMNKVEMVEADDLNCEEFQLQFPECARVSIEELGGCTYSGFLGAAIGMPRNPMSDKALSDKYRECVSLVGWPEKKIEAVLEGLWNIEHVSSISQLLNDCVE